MLSEVHARPHMHHGDHMAISLQHSERVHRPPLSATALGMEFMQLHNVRFQAQCQTYSKLQGNVIAKKWMASLLCDTSEQIQPTTYSTRIDD
mmetsp:Transcript_7482/g.23175  ORF Transcript_7482/g.23175 Transcript_7482/m.23175 type:complete len:92 (+) Transcript_7482:481-756(+)|eukprot:scaffold212866_cov33-Tisochrysis_lutea.AAC.1